MACGIEFLKWMGETGVLPRRGRLLDIGESCLLGAEAHEIKEVLRRHGCKLDEQKVNKLAHEYAYRSKLMGAPIPTLFLGEVLEHTDVEYISFDVVSTRVARLFDLNKHDLNPAKKGTFDAVVNFGTTEHLINQYNAFKVMHEAAKPGGFMFSQIPSTGYINHGYFCYNALMFRELAEANGYETVDLWFYGPNDAGNVLVNADNYPGVLDGRKLRNNVEAFKNAPVPNALINVLFRKVHDAPFKVGLEVKTAASQLRQDASYDGEYIDPRTLGAVAAAPAKAPFLKRLLGKLAGARRAG
jgi:hypothetical protein